MSAKFLNRSASKPKSESAMRKDQPGRISRKMKGKSARHECH